MRAAWLVVVTACWHGGAGEPTAPARPGAVAPRDPVVRIAHVVRGPGDAPSIEMAQALAAAKRYAAQHDVHFDDQYLQGAVFDSSSRQWVFDWQTPNAKGGMTIISVHESGTIAITYGE